MTVIDTVFHLLFRCAHRHLTRPFTPLGEEGSPCRESYVVCLDCTMQFTYDLKEMWIGKMIDRSHDACSATSRYATPAYQIGVCARGGSAARSPGWRRLAGEEVGEGQEAEPGRTGTRQEQALELRGGGRLAFVAEGAVDLVCQLRLSVFRR